MRKILLFLISFVPLCVWANDGIIYSSGLDGVTASYVTATYVNKAGDTMTGLLSLSAGCTIQPNLYIEATSAIGPSDYSIKVSSPDNNNVLSVFGNGNMSLGTSAMNNYNLNICNGATNPSIQLCNSSNGVGVNDGFILQQNSTTGLLIVQKENLPILTYTNSTLRQTITASGQFWVEGASNFASSMTVRNDIQLGNNTVSDTLIVNADTATFNAGSVVISSRSWNNVPSAVANSIVLYSSAPAMTGVAELFVLDSGGNLTQLSPHNTDNEWIYNSQNTFTGKKVYINMEYFISRFEAITGEKFIFSSKEEYEDYISEK
jgi:hypothetical protein